MKRILIGIVFLLMVSPAEAAYLDLAWTPNTEPDLAGYQVHYGTESGIYTDTVDVGNTTNYRLDGLVDGVTYYIALTAYDTVDNESDYSAEVSGAAASDAPVPEDPDSDRDGLPDEWEMVYFGNLAEGPDGDSDGDGGTNLDEYQYGTDPTNLDTDSDQMPDGWEMQYGLDPLDAADANADSDGDGLTNLDEYWAGTNPWNAPPRADAGPDQTVDEGVTATLDGSNSSDPDDGIASYLWEQTAGVTVTLSETSAIRTTFTAPGVSSGGESLTFTLTVTDSSGLQSTDTCVVNVTLTDIPPTADAGPDQTVDEGTTVTLDGSGSFDPDDGIDSYLWEQTAGPSVTLSDPRAVQPSFVSPNVNRHGKSLTFRLTVADKGGLKSRDTSTTNVTWVNAPPKASVGQNKRKNVKEGSKVILDASSSSDPDDGIASYLWKQTSGIPVTFSDPTDVDPTIVMPPVDAEETDVSFQITVTDNGGLQSSDEISLTIEDNGITGFPDDVITATASTGEDLGIKVDSGGRCVYLDPVDPSTIRDNRNRPENLICGVIDTHFKVDTVGGTVVVTFYFEAPVPEWYQWYKYNPAIGWYDYSEHAVFNSARDQVTVILVDGGAGDDDGVANGVIVDPSALGTASTEGTPGGIGAAEPSSDDSAKGCFISSVAKPGIEK